MNQLIFERRFTDLIFDMLTALGFEVEKERKFLITRNRSFYADLAIRKNDLKAIIELKSYRSRKVSSSIIQSAILQLVSLPVDQEFQKILVVSSILSSSFKAEVISKFGIIVWDRSNIANFLAAASKDEYLEEFGRFLLEAQQGTDTEDPYYGIDESTDTNPDTYFAFTPVANTSIDSILNKGDKLFQDLQAIPKGKVGWSDFESKCLEILEYLFSNDLSGWNCQQITDDKLSRFDLICRIGSTDDFWKTLINSFSSRYILFEFKNYDDLLPQGQVYTTERYLYPKALRGTCILIARSGSSQQAIDATKGALKEGGKLVLLLDENDLQKMLIKTDQGESPNDYLSEKLDDFLISLSR